MTYEEAKKNITAYIYAECENMPKQVIEALDIARQAINKQIPKKIGFFEKSNVDECSVCGYTLRSKNWKYCPVCGQAVDRGE